MGEEVAAGEVMKTVQRDMAFYRRSGGGVTFSGGEPLCQPDFLEILLKKCEALGLNTAIETCGHFNWRKCKDVIKRADLVYLDIKHMDPVRHRELTGVSNETILQNAINIAAEHVPLIIRIPVIPSLNDSVENITATVEFARRNLRGAKGIEFMSYHTLGKEKYAAIGLDYKLEHIRVLDDEEMNNLRKLVDCPRQPSLVNWRPVA